MARSTARAVAAALVLLTLAARLEFGSPALDALLGFLPALLLGAWLAGWRTAMAATVATAALAWWFVLRAPGAPAPTLPDAGASVALAVFVSAALGGTYVVATMAREVARQRALLEATREAERAWQHRVANDLQLVGAALAMQQRRAESPDAQAALQDAAGRLIALARLQRMGLAARAAFDADVDLAALLRDLCQDTLAAAGTGRISCVVEASEAILLSAERAGSVALVASEALTLALRHANGGSETTRVRIALGHADHRIELRIEAAGVGNSRGVARAMIESLVARLGGTIAPDAGVGVLAFSFPDTAPETLPRDIGLA